MSNAFQCSVFRQKSIRWPLCLVSNQTLNKSVKTITFSAKMFYLNIAPQEKRFKYNLLLQFPTICTRPTKFCADSKPYLLYIRSSHTYFIECNSFPLRYTVQSRPLVAQPSLPYRMQSSHPFCTEYSQAHIALHRTSPPGCTECRQALLAVQPSSPSCTGQPFQLYSPALLAVQPSPPGCTECRPALLAVEPSPPGQIECSPLGSPASRKYITPHPN